MLLLPEDLTERNTFLRSFFMKGTVAFIEHWRCLSCPLGTECLYMQMGNPCPCQVSFDEQHLQAALKNRTVAPACGRGTWEWCPQINVLAGDPWSCEDTITKSSLKLLLVEALEKIDFGLRGLWGCVQSAAQTLLVQQVKLFPEAALGWLNYLCSLLDVTLPEPKLP